MTVPIIFTIGALVGSLFVNFLFGPQIAIANLSSVLIGAWGMWLATHKKGN